MIRAARIAELWGLRIQVLASSWYYPGRSLMVWIHRKADHRRPGSTDEQPRPDHNDEHPGPSPTSPADDRKEAP